MVETAQHARDFSLPFHPFMFGSGHGENAISAQSVSFSVHQELAAAEAVWREFEQRAASTVFQTFDWLSHWQRCIGERDGVRPAIIIGRGTQDEVLFILPLSLRRLGFARELAWLGSDLCDYNAPLLAAGFNRRVSPESFIAIWKTITQHLQDDSELRYDLIRLEKMPSTVEQEPNPMLQLGVTLNPSGAYVSRLGQSWEAFYAAKRSKATRNRDRTKRKRLGEAGKISLVQPAETADLKFTVDVLMEQKARSFARMGVTNLFARPGYADFFRAVAGDPGLRSMVHVSRLEVGGEIAATNLGLTFHGSYYHVLASHTDSDLSRFGPGMLHLHELFRHAIEQNLHSFDFTVGDEPYKRDWADVNLRLYDHVGIASSRGALTAIPLLGLHKLKRWIKQTPVAWRLFTEARRRLRGFRTPASAQVRKARDGDAD